MLESVFNHLYSNIMIFLLFLLKLDLFLSRTEELSINYFNILFVCVRLFPL
jgi:hypothetical protein